MLITGEYSNWLSIKTYKKCPRWICLAGKYIAFFFDETIGIKWKAVKLIRWPDSVVNW